MAVSLQAAPRSQSNDDEDALLRGRYTQVERVQLVLIPATVTNARGLPIPGLEQRDFRLTVDGHPRSIEYFATESNVPIAVAFLLDLSGSMRQESKLPEALAAIASFVDTMGPADRFGLIGFADEQVTWITEFTSDKGWFKKRLGVQRAYGQSAIYDALAACPKLVDDTPEARKAIVLLTDGLDNASLLAPLQAMQIARHVPVPIYTVGFTSQPPEMLSRENRDAITLVERFSRETGGVLLPVRSPDALRGAVERIRQDLRSQYVIGFEPEGSERNRFQRIQLETTSKRHRVRCRTGYYPGP